MKKSGWILLLSVLLIACSKPADEVTLTVLHTNDTHSQVLPYNNNMGGYARRVGVINKERAQDPDVILLDAGDFSQGTPFFNYFHGRVEIDAMNWAKYDAATLGNHEFDNGIDTLAMILRRANFPIVCANYDVSGTVLEGLVEPYVILNRKGVKVGVFGLGCYPYSVISDANFGGIKYKENSYEVAQQMADELRAKGCDVVICLSHQGTKPHDGGAPCDMQMIPLTTGIDVVIGGHTHEMIVDSVLPNKEGKDVAICQMAKRGEYLGRIMLHLHNKNEK